MGTLGIILTVLASLILVFVCAWLYLAAPSRYDKRMDKYKNTKYAHRGLHGDGACENSLSAFRRAAEAGFGIELDVRLAGDGRLVVFHDDSLIRVCGIDKKVNELSTEELRSVKLGETEDCVPTFLEVLELIGGRVPLLIEIKMEPGEDAVAEELLREIEGYNGDFIIESFNPRALRIIREARPDILRGFLSMEYSKTERFGGKAVYRALEYLLLDFLYRPNFIAYDKSGRDKPYLKLIRKLFRVPMLAWTVKSAEEEKECSGVFDSVIFEGYMPER